MVTLIDPFEVIEISDNALKVNPLRAKTASSLIEPPEAKNNEGLKANEEIGKSLSLTIDISLFDEIEIAPAESIKLFLKFIPEIFAVESLEIIARSPPDFILASEEALATELF